MWPGLYVQQVLLAARTVPVEIAAIATPAARIRPAERRTFFGFINRSRLRLVAERVVGLVREQRRPVLRLRDVHVAERDQRRIRGGIDSELVDQRLDRRRLRAAVREVVPLASVDRDVRVVVVVVALDRPPLVAPAADVRLVEVGPLVLDRIVAVGPVVPSAPVVV